jgi:hypothetical protein
MTDFTSKLTLGISTAALLSFAAMQAQEAAHPLPRHPGDVIKYRVVFDGPNADRIKYLNTSIGLRTGAPKDQAGFSGGVSELNVAPSSPQTFDLKFTIPENAADGEYYLNFSAFADEGYGNYSDGQEFNVPPVHVENPKKFTPPAVKVTSLP